MTIEDKQEPEVIIWIENQLGRIRLNRPKALNALNHGMAKSILFALKDWRESNSINAVLIDSTGERAFCAGGDVAEVYRARDTDISKANEFFIDEYNLNLTIAEYPKPFIAFMDGFVMGGGIGLSAHGSHRIVTERTMLAMPECAIGLIPDVGATWLLHNAPGEIGKWMGMTGARLNAADAIYAGFADAYVPSNKLGLIAENIADGASADVAIAAVSEVPAVSHLIELERYIDEAFSNSSTLKCLDHLKLLVKQGDDKIQDWAQKSVTAIEHGAPFATVATFEAQLLASKFKSAKDALTLEYRYVSNAINSADFFEGVRAMLIDKDKSPKWNPKTLEEVPINNVRACFVSLGENELKFNV